MKCCLLPIVIFLTPPDPSLAQSLRDGMRPESDSGLSGTRVQTSGLKALGDAKRLDATAYWATPSKQQGDSTALRSGMRPEQP
jgi:hypothetical protein